MIYKKIKQTCIFMSFYIYRSLKQI